MFTDERAAAELLGFVLAFSLVVTTFAIYQSDVIPHQNKEAEIEYSDEAATELTQLQSTVGEVGSTGAPATSTVPGGATYPDRALGINAERPGGNLDTTDRYAVELSGFETTDARYWDGTTRNYHTRLLRFTPNYNYYNGEERFYLANGVALKEARKADYTDRLSGTVVDGDHIDLPLLSGDLQRTGRSLDVSFSAVSSTTEYRTVEVTESPSPPNFAYVRVPTVRSQSAWDSVAASSANVSRVEVYCLGTTQPKAANCPDEPVSHAEIVLEQGSYKLRVSNVTVDQPTTPSATYLTMQPAGEVTENNGQTFVVTTRDRFGNPVSGVDVDLTKSGPGSLTTTAQTTSDDGQATFSVTGAELGVTTVTASIDNGPPNPAYETESLTVGTTTASGAPPMTVYTSGQIRRGLSGMNSLVISDGMMVPGSDSDCLLIGDTGGLLGGLLGALNCNDNSYDTVQGQLRVETNNNKQYQITFILVDENENGQLDGGDSKRVYIESDTHGKVFEGELQTGKSKDALDADGVDLLDSSSYASTKWENTCSPVDLSCTEWGGGDPYSSFGDLDLSQAELVFVERAAGRVTVNASST